MNDNRDNGAPDGLPESDYSRQTVRGKGLRTGYTTGSCAAAAAKAAVTALLTGESVERVSIHLPVGREVEFAVHRCQRLDGGRVVCSVLKDGGDDPDATHGAEICATISLVAADGGVAATPETGASGRPAAGADSGVAAAPDGAGPPADAVAPQVRIAGGPGVGTVTRPGTGIAVGEPAVTRVPRRMITESALAGAAAAGLPPGRDIIVEVSVPGGEEIALKTTNARLGVLGGISILGSTGVVQPYSTAAWRASVHLSIDVAAANGLPHVVLSTGTQSEAFTKSRLDLPEMAYIEAGIFSGPSLKRCVMRGIPRATHSGMIGKFSKMAMGYFVTHVAGNRVDCGYLADLAAEFGASAAVQEEMRQASSGRHFQEIAQANGLLALFPELCQRVCEASRRHLGADADALIVDALCFDFDGTLLGSASTAPGGVPLVSPAGAAAGAVAGE